MPARLTHSALARSLGRCLSERAASTSSTSTATATCRIACATTSSPSSSSIYTSSRLRLGQSSAGFHTTSANAAFSADFKLELPADYVPPTQPPSAKRPALRKTQLLRQYTSMMRTTPLMLLFQHNNLTGAEWAALRREVSLATRKVSEDQKALGIEWPENFADNVRIQVIRTRIFDLALRVAEFYDPSTVTADSTAAVVRGRGKAGAIYNHDVSDAAAAAVKKAMADGLTTAENSSYAQLQPLLVGPLMLVTLPDVSPAHLAAALSVLAPSPPKFPPPSRKKNPGYYEPLVQGALPKLLLIGGRVEGKAFDSDGLKWVGSIEGGRAGLQAQLVHMLQSAGLGLTSALEGASKSLWLTMESRKVQLEDEAKPKEAAAEGAADGAAEAKEESK